MKGDYCKRYAKVWWLHNREKRRVTLGRLRCKQWACPYCARENQREIRQFLLTTISKMADREWFFMTITARGDTRGRIESYKQLAKGIDRLIKAFNRVWNRVDYVRVYEVHPKSEAIHAHFLVSNLTPFVRVEKSKNGRKKYTPANTRAAKRGYWTLYTFVKKMSHRSGMGYMADVSQVEHGADGISNVTRYITKITSYLTKESQSIDIKGIRHVQTSRAIGSIKARREFTGEIGQAIPYSAIPRGFSLIDRDTGEVIQFEYWLENGFYPPQGDRDG